VKSRPIAVEIYDQKYTIVLQTALEEAEVRSLADEVDLRMREIAAVASTADSLKVAVLAALHFAQELRELRRNTAQNDALINTKAAEWTRTLEQVLKKGI
jgi:cell division protein ZapA